MKKTILFLACVFSALSGYAQLKVNSSGKVGINYSSSLSNSLTVGGNSNSFTASIRPTRGDGLYIRTGSGGFYNRYGMQILTDLGNDTITYSLYVSQTEGTSNETAYGIKSCSGRSSIGSFGVAGGLFGVGQNIITRGAGIYGSANAVLTPFTGTGIYAGYFKGDVRVTGTLYGTLVTPSSSAGASNSTAIVVGAYNTRGEGFDEEGVSDKLQQVQLLQFYRSPDENKLSEEEIEAQREELRRARLARQESLTDGTDIAKDEEDIENLIEYEVPQTKLSTIRYGLDTEQLKSVYPELVYEDANGNVSINYIEMIPLLVQAVNEVKTENEALKDKLAELTGSKEAKAKVRLGATSIDSADEVILSLSQNNPNPFSTATSIAVSVPESIKTATLFVYDMSGKQIKRIDIAERMYLYSLIADGKVVGTKKMILVK